MIKVKDISRSFGTNQVLTDIALTLESSKVTSIVGPNGMGKTTFINVLADLLIADKGSIEYSDGFYPQDMFLVLSGDKNLYVKNTVEENIEFFAVLRNVPKDEINRRIEKYKVLFDDYDELKDKLTETLSFGQKRLVVIMSALVSGANCLVLDEVSEGLDLHHKDRLIDILNKIKKDRIILLASHDYEFVSKVSDHTAFLKHGEFVEIVDKVSKTDLVEKFHHHYDDIVGSRGFSGEGF